MPRSPNNPVVREALYDPEEMITDITIEEFARRTAEMPFHVRQCAHCFVIRIAFFCHCGLNIGKGARAKPTYAVLDEGMQGVYRLGGMSAVVAYVEEKYGTRS